jgi:2-polyprenyl-3-methyl-5-hydroxy-6-metoxy-1,4-benzoquinol methylase
MTLVVAPCAFCGSTAFDPVYPGTIPSDDDRDPSLYFSSSRTSAGYLPVVRCVTCRLVMTNPRDSDDTLARVYAALSDRLYEQEDVNRTRSAQRSLSLVAEFVRPPARLLDVGCATGIFVRVAHEAGWRTTGFDASAWAVMQARARCPSAEFHSGRLEELSFAKGGFDVITMWDVLEHVSAPLYTLLRVREWLTPEGWLFLSLPNADSLVARTMGRRWVLLLREHLWYFSPMTISGLLRRAGFEPVRTRPKFVSFSLANILSRLAQYPGRLGRTAAGIARAPTLARISLRFPMGEMHVVARRESSGGRMDRCY